LKDARLAADAALLYLYSSNIRPLYEQDILDLLASPPGLPYQFRYEARYVDDHTRTEWLGLAGKMALIHFSLQQEAKFHEPAFIPVRLATVRRAFHLGDIHVVELNLDAYVALPEPPQEEGEPNLARPVREYTDYLEGRGVPRPYGPSAGLGENILLRDDLPLERGTDEMLLFSRTCRYLQRTQSFRAARFYRFLRLTDKKGDGTEKSVDESGVFILDGGRSYELALAHQQPADVPQPERFSVSVDGSICRLIGKQEFEIASRYDIITIPFYAVESAAYETSDTVLVIEPETTQGARLRLPIRIRSPLKRAAGAVSGSVFGLVLLGIPALFPHLDSAIKVLFIAVGGLMTGVLATLGLKRG